MTYVISFNGPPRTGKDTVANTLRDNIDASDYMTPTCRLQLSLPIRKMAFAVIGMEYTEAVYEELKDTPIQLLTQVAVYEAIGFKLGHHRSDGPWTLRELVIWLADSCVRNTFGPHFWALNGIVRTPMLIHNQPGLVLCSDGGFQPEIDYLAGHVNPDNFLLVRLRRDGTNWFKDSRGDLTAVHSLFVENNGTPNDAAQQILSHTLRLGWQL